MSASFAERMAVVRQYIHKIDTDFRFAAGSSKEAATAGTGRQTSPPRLGKSSQVLAASSFSTSSQVVLGQSYLSALKVISDVKVAHLRTPPSIHFYQTLSREFTRIIDEPFVSSESLVNLGRKYLESMRVDIDIVDFNSSLRGVEVKATSDLLRVFLDAKRLVESIEKSLAVERKSVFIELLFTQIKQLNGLTVTAQNTLATLTRITVKASIDLAQLASQKTEEQQAKLLVSFDFDEAVQSVKYHLEQVIPVVDEGLRRCEDDPSSPAKSAHLALQIKAALQQADLILREQNSLFNQLCLFSYLELRRILFYTREELARLEPYLEKINRSVCDILYLHFVKKKETTLIKAQFESYVKELKGKIREPLDSQPNNEVVREILSRSEGLLSDLNGFKGMHASSFSECFTAFFERKRMKRKREIKQLKNEIMMFQQALTLIVEIIDSGGVLRRLLTRSREFAVLVEQIESVARELVKRTLIRSRIPQENTEINELRSTARGMYIESEQIISELRKYEDQYVKYFEITQFFIFANLLEKTLFDLRNAIAVLYSAEERLAEILQKEAKVASDECTTIRDETAELLQDIYDFFQAIDLALLQRTDNRRILDEKGSLILKILMRLKKKQAQIELNLNEKSAMMPSSLSSELSRMASSLAYQLTNLECIGVIIDSRQYFNSECIVSAVYELVTATSTMMTQSDTPTLTQTLESLAEHEIEVRDFLRDFSPSISRHLRQLAEQRLAVESFYSVHFTSIIQYHTYIREALKETKAKAQSLQPTNQQQQQQNIQQVSLLLDNAFVDQAKHILSLLVDMEQLTGQLISIDSVFPEELKKKLKSPLCSYVEKLAEIADRDFLAQQVKAATAMIGYTSSKEKIFSEIINILLLVKERPRGGKSSSYQHIIFLLRDYFNILADARLTKTLQDAKPSQQLITTDEFSRFTSRTSEHEKFAFILYDICESFCKSSSQSPITVGSSSNIFDQRDDQSSQQQLDNLQIITETKLLQSTFKSSADAQIKAILKEIQTVQENI